MSKDKAKAEGAAKGGRARSTATAQARKSQIAGAVIEVLARDGARALTHRRIDAHLGLPEGATSYYFPRSFELLKAGFNKLFDDSLVEFERCYVQVIRRIEAQEALSIGDVAECAYRHWRLISQASRRDLAIARFEFYLLATHDKTLLDVQSHRRLGLFDLTTRIFAGLGCRNPMRAASEFRSRSQADYVSHFIAPSFERVERTRSDFATRIRQVIVEADAAPSDRGAPLEAAPLIAV